MSTSKKLDEITELAIMLQNSWQGITIDEISDKLERNRRAVERLMEVIKEKFGERLEVVENNYDRKKHWRLRKNSMNFLVTFSDLELSKLLKLSSILKNEADKKSILDIMEKIKILNPKNHHQNDIDILLESQGLAVRQYSKENINSDFMEKIAYAIQSEQRIKISYTDSYGNFYEPVIEPYGLQIADNHYLIAKEDKIKIFKISKIKNIEILNGNYFEKDENFNIQEYCNRSFGIYNGKIEEVVLQFSSEAAEYILNYHFHPTQIIEKQKDGSVIVKFKASGSYEIVTELLKWREGVKILSPENIKQEYEQTVKLMYQNIESNKIV
ncbi:WYL domain-containing protein [bacterium]|nr:WYL domain-containing protein [bacterium]